jgi:phosphoenolpyruvate-protein kinase (PTS system EI component)|tara:strand:- start:95 stop:286 length:192 start_codon:yes stop_codon:yes gene_type:complete
MAKISADDLNAIAHVNHVSNSLHDSVDDLYEDLMERDHEAVKQRAQDICKVCADLIQSLTDEI